MIVGNLALSEKLYMLRRRSELTKAGKVRAELLGKQQHMMSQLEQYKQYVNHCLANLNKRQIFSQLMGSYRKGGLPSVDTVNMIASAPDFRLLHSGVRIHGS